MSSLTRRLGVVISDHRACPGLQPKGTPVYQEIPTLSCRHCGNCVVLNPERTRERHICFTCMAYICDTCKAITLEPDYVHRPFSELADLVMSGNWTLAGSSTRPILIPNSKEI